MKVLKGEIKAQRQAGHNMCKKDKKARGVEDAGQKNETELCGRKLGTLEHQVGKYEPDPDSSGEH